MKELQEALINPKDTQELKITYEDLERGLPREIADMTQLKSLSITGAQNGSVPFPKVFLDLPIEEIELRHFRAHEIFPLKNLVKLKFSGHFIYDDIQPVCVNLQKLKYLEIWGGYNKVRSLEIPPEIQNLSDLSELHLISCKVKELPDELCRLTKLKTIHLRNQNFTEFPKVLTKITSLEDLVVSSCPQIQSLPEELKNLINLKHLNLEWSFKKINSLENFEDELDAFFDDMDESEGITGWPIPSVIGELTNLISLNLDHCDVSDITPLNKLMNLETLSLASSKITDLLPISELANLKFLNLDMNYKIKDISNMPSSLQNLNLDSTHIKDISAIVKLPNLDELSINGCSDLTNIQVVFQHPNLKKLNANSEVSENWKRRDELKTLPPPDKIKLKMGSSLLSEVKEGIAEFFQYIDLNSTRDVNAIYNFFNLNQDDFEETEIIEIEELKSLINRHGTQLDTESLLNLIRSTFRDVYENFQTTLDVIQILIDRKDVIGQNEVVEQFKYACEFYDPGHRYWEDTVQDQLLDQLFPEFEGEPLVNLLLWCSLDNLMNDMGLDGMDFLYSTAFDKVSSRPELADKLFEHFNNYIGKCDADYVKSSGLLELLEKYGKSSPSSETPITQMDSDKGIETEVEKSTQELKQLEVVNLEEEFIKNYSNEIQKAVEKFDVAEVVRLLPDLTKISSKSKIDFIVGAYIYNIFNISLKSNKLKDAETILTAYMELTPKIGHSVSLSAGSVTGTMAITRERFAGDAVVLYALTKKENIWKLAEELIPQNITLGVLSFNLSCLYALRKDKSNMLKYVKLSLNLGKKKSEFLADSDFSEYFNDPDFISLVQ
ncbi:leucine-rich repeat domain-containing protein (plasmid) [Leptospira sp. WS60.C2]